MTKNKILFILNLYTEGLKVPKHEIGGSNLFKPFEDMLYVAKGSIYGKRKFYDSPLHYFIGKKGL